MTRVFLITALAFGAVSQAAQAQDKEAECAVQTDVVMQVVAARSGGADAADATRGVAADLSGDAAKYASIVPALVDWVYTLPDDQLNDTVGQSWTEACLAQ